MKRFSKIVFHFLVAPILLFLLMGLLWLNADPEFGGRPTSEDIKKYQRSDQFDQTNFVNQIPTTMDLASEDIIPLLKEYYNGSSRDPETEPSYEHVNPNALKNSKAETKVLWLGHSAVLLQIDGKNVLFDPMLGESPAPHPVVGTKRYYQALPLEITELPQIDLVLISHDHYDHLDYGSILQLKEKTKSFIVPLGVGAHLKAWGIAPSKITELDWWNEQEAAGLKIVLTPARHFSGRALHDRNRTLWGSFVVQGKYENIYFSGDGGYGEHFKTIGDKFGPFDFALLECGQYHKNWAQIHMMPEETAQAGIDLKAKRIMPIHWGAFTLSLHHWTDPIERVTIKAMVLGIPLVHPKIGQYFSLKDSSFTGDIWWRK